MAGEDTSQPPPPQITSTEAPQIVSSVKLHILKKGEYILWTMKMEQYLAHTDYALWKVILNGNSAVQMTKDEAGNEVKVPLVTAQQILARTRERKAKSTLLMAILDEHLAIFHRIKDAKTLWAAIKTRFGEGLDKGYDRFQRLLGLLEIHEAGVSTEDANQNFLISQPSAWSNIFLIIRNKPCIDNLDIDDLYNNLKAYEVDIKGSFGSSSNSQSVAFVSAESTSSTNELNVVYSVSTASGHSSQVPEKGTLPEIAEQPGTQGIGVEMLGMQVKEEATDFALMDFTSNPSSSSSSNSEEEVTEIVFDNRSSDEENSVANDRFKKGEGCHAVPPLLTKNYMPPKPDLSFARLDESIYKFKISETVTSLAKDENDALETSTDFVEKTKEDRSSAPLIEDWETDSVFTPEPILAKIDFVKAGESIKHVKPVKSVRHVKPVTPIKTAEHTKKSKNFSSSPKVDRKNQNGKMTQKLRLGFGFIKKACFVCGSLSHLIKDYTFHEDRMAKKSVLPTNVGKGTVVFTKSGRIPVSAAKPKAATLTSAAKPVNTVGPRQSVNFSRTTSTFHKSHSPIRRSFYKATAHSKRNSTEKVNTAGSKAVSDVKENGVTDVKTSASCVWGPKDHPQQALKNKRIVDKGCSRHMTGNKAYLADYQEIHDGGFVAFGSSRSKITCKGESSTKPHSCRKKDRTLIEAARTMLADSILPITFWAEAVNIACYVLNRALVTKTQNKTPYELLNGRTPRLDFMRNFSCPVTILNTLDPFGNFKGKADEEFLDGYSVTSKAFGVFNSKTRKVEENLHVRKEVSDQHYIVLPLWSSISSTYKSLDDKPTDDKPKDDTANATRKEFEQGFMDQREFTKAGSTNSFNTVSNPFNAASTSRTFSACGPSSPHPDAFIPANTLLHFNVCAEVNFNNMESSTIVSPIHTHKMEPKKVSQDVDDESWVEAMQEENKKDKRGLVVRNKARLVVQGHIQEEGIDYDEVFAPVARIEAIRIFLAFASFMGFIVYQMDVKSAFLYGTIEKEMYSLCDEFKALMHKRFQMSSMGKLIFFLRLQVKQSEEGIFISQDKYVAEILRKFDLSSIKIAGYIKLSHLQAVKRILRYLKGQPKLDIWYPRDSPFDLEAYSDSDYAKENLDNKSTTGETFSLINLYMADLKFVDQHNMVACLEKTEENAEFHQIVDFLSTCSINYALTVSLTIYASYIKQFWNTAISKTVNSVKQIHAIVDGKVVVISESSMRSDLLFNDENVSHEPQIETHIEQILPSPSTYQRKHRKTRKPRKSKKATELPQTSVPLDIGADDDVHHEGIGTSKKKTLDKEHVSKQGRDESNKTEELNLSDKGSGETKVFDYTTAAKKDVNAAEPVSTFGDVVNAASVIPDVSVVGPSTSATSPSISTGKDIFEDEMTTMADILMAIMRTRPRTTSVVIHDVEEEPRKTTPPPTVQCQECKYTHNQLKSKSFEEIQMLYEREQKWINDFVPMDFKEVDDSEQQVEDDIAIDVESLATKYPTVNWKTHTLTEHMMYYQIIRANGSSKNYKILTEMYDDFDRQDIMDLYRLVKERYETASPKGYNLLLWGDLITLFEPSEKDVIWKAQQDYNLTNWRMLNRRLEIDHESEMAFGLICLSSNQRHFEMKPDHVTKVAIPFEVENFIIEWIMEGIDLNAFNPNLPRITLYSEGSLITVNFIIVLLHKNSFPKHTSSSILPNGLVTSSEKPTKSVCVSFSHAFIVGLRFSKQCSNITSTNASSSTYTHLTKYPSTSASTIKGSFETSSAETDENVMGVFI
nr:hypothetical protein [Tanacetum cinerariifolium]